MRIRSGKRAFSLVELVIVVVIIGVIAAIAVPRISRGAKGAGESALRGSLASLRNAIDMYAAEHGGAFPGADNLEATLLRQLTEKTDAFGTCVAPGCNFGPYLRRAFPPCPVGACTGNTGVFLAATGPVVAAGTAGWVYNSATGEIIVNSDDLVEGSTTVKYNTY